MKAINFFLLGILFTACDRHVENKKYSIIEKKEIQSYTEIYAIPRNSSYGVSNNGIYNWPLQKKSRYKFYAERTYDTDQKYDSVCEYYYGKLYNHSLDSYFDNNFEFAKDSIALSQIRILIINNNESIFDTIYIDGALRMKRHGKIYELEKDELSELFSLFPIELRKHWQLNLPSVLFDDDVIIIKK